MFFEKIGHFATRYRIPILLVWIVAAIVVTVAAPSIDKVASSNMSDFLPDDAPFIHASNVINDTFGKGLTGGSTVIVIDARDAGGVRSDATWAFMTNFQQWLTSDDAPDNITRVVSPTDSEAIADMMISQDGGVALMRVALSTTGTEKATGQTLEAIDNWIHQRGLPNGVDIYQTGDSPIVNNTTESVKTSVDRTIWVTIALVIVMLAIVYRSPISPLVPLVSVTLAYLITRGIVAWLGDTVMTITSYANVMLVVVMYGAGTDYCLFLISRFREEMADHPTIDQATAHTVHLVGETISSSAGTIFVGFMAMAFAKMGIFKTSGPALAIGIVLSLLAGLTLVPALLATLGQKAFWPGQATHRSPGRLYEFTSKQVSNRPLLTIVIIVALMLPFSIYGISERVNYNMLDDLPDSQPAVKGFAIMNDTMGSGEILPLTVAVTGRDPDEIAADMVHLSSNLEAVDGIKYIRSLNNPMGEQGELTNLLRVDVQLRLALQMFSQLGTSGAAAGVDVQQLGGMVSSLSGYFDLLAEKFPEVANDPNLLTIQELLGSPLRLIQGQDELAAAVEDLATRFETVEDPYVLPTMFVDLLSQMPSEDQGTTTAMLGQLLPNYITSDYTAYKLEVILDVPPTSYEAMDTVHAMRNVLAQYGDGGEAVVGGNTATVTDIKDTMDSDLLRAISLVLLGIFLVLLVMLRSAVAPLYLIGTVLLSFTFTLGVTNFVFQNFAGAEALTWYVPFFTFVFLVALGVDYSIFLFGRIKEEVGYHGIREGVHVAVARTGAIITSAGMILAGTFGAMISGEIRGLVEVGFAVAFGVLIDTFIVRTILDPALATLFGRWTWWPGGVPKAHAVRPGQAVAAGDSAD